MNIESRRTGATIRATLERPHDATRTCALDTLHDSGSTSWVA